MSTVPSHMVAGMGRVAGDGLPVGNVLKPLKPRTSSRRDHETWDEELKELAARLGLEAMHSKSPNAQFGGVRSAESKHYGDFIAMDLAGPLPTAAFHDAAKYISLFIGPPGGRRGATARGPW